MNGSVQKKHDFRNPASFYRLRVTGTVPAGWEGRLGCLRIVQEEVAGLDKITTLMGAVSDQADLLGVLNTLQQLHLPLLLVEAVDIESIPSTSHPERS